MATAKKILIVEDDVMLVNILKTRLSAEGFLVSVASDGDEAIEKMKLENPHLVLLDLLLPKKSGFELLEEIVRSSTEFKKIPVLILSNLSRESDIEKSKSLGATDYLVKAKLSIDELIEKVKGYLGE
ncbi:MAG: response regulator [Parcubacteria group bacterium]|nr:response regulator [Parcubacteria group bacterium]